MGYLSHRVDRCQIKAGDHIYTWRTGFTYAHHGIYVGGNKVIHFTSDQENAKSYLGWNLCSSLPIPSSCLNSKSNPGWNLCSSLPVPSSCLNSIDGGFPPLESDHNCDSGSCLCPDYCGFHEPESGVTFSCLNCFVGTGSVYLYQYGVNKWMHVSKLRGGTSTTAQSDPPQVVIDRAIYLFGQPKGFGEYKLYRNNCEDFALYCKTGLLIDGKPTTGGSGQVNSIVNAPWKPALVSVLPKVVCSTTMGALAVGVTVGTHYWNRYKTDIGVRGDVIKVEVEDVGDRDQFKAGDHIYTWRTAFTYAHHGIYVGGNKVIHFTSDQENAKSYSGWNLCSSLPIPSSCLNSKSNPGWNLCSSLPIPSSCLNSIDGGFPPLESEHNCDSGSCLCPDYCGFHQPESGVTFSCLNCFVGTGSVYLYQYGVNKWMHVSKLRGGTSTTAQSDPPQVVIDRTKYLFGQPKGFGEYNVYRNNCEDFALYCKTGLLIDGKPTTGGSGQVNSIVNALWKPVVCSVFQKAVSSTPSTPLTVATVVVQDYMDRYKTDIGVRGDVIKVEVEDVELFRLDRGY